MSRRHLSLVVPPPVDGSVVSDYAGGLGFEPLGDYVLPPLDLLQIAAVAQATFEPELLDFAVAPLDRASAVNRILESRPDIVIVQADLPTLASTMLFARAIRAAGVRTLIRIQRIEAPTLRRLNVELADEWLWGDCYFDLPSILEGVPSPFTFCGSDVPPWPGGGANVGKLPFPLHRLLKPGAYVYPKLGHCFTVITSRGCPFPCGYFCPYPLVQGNRWQARAPADVIAEIGDALDFGLPPHVLFRDAVFTLDSSRTLDLCSGIERGGLCFTWWCETRADLLDEVQICAMARAGCVGVNLGVETGDEELRLRLLKGRTTDHRLSATTLLLRRYGIASSLLFMCGWPTETVGSLVKTAELIERVRPASAGVVFPTAYPGTQFHDDLVRSGLLDEGALPTSGAVPQVPSEHLAASVLIEARRHLIDIARLASDPAVKSSDVAERVEELRSWAHVQ
ncbi:MAG: radical SAM protein [Magnetospirillum sp. WYHS-4]